MKFKVDVEGFEGQDLEVDYSFWTGTKLFVNGQQAPKGEKRGEFTLSKNDGSMVVGKWKAVFLFGFDVPQLVVGDRVIDVVEPLKWYQWLWSGWMVIFIFIGGALGAVSAVLAFGVNTRIFRSTMNEALKYVLTAGVSLFAVGFYFVLALPFRWY
jgi:hypothetical protein